MYATNQPTNYSWLATYHVGIVEIYSLKWWCKTVNIPFKCLFMCAWTSSHLHELMSALYTFSFSLPTSRAMPAGPWAVPKIWFSSCRCPARWVGAHAPVNANNKHPLLPQIKTRLTVSNVKEFSALHIVLHRASSSLLLHVICWLPPPLSAPLSPTLSLSLSLKSRVRCGWCDVHTKSSGRWTPTCISAFTTAVTHCSWPFLPYARSETRWRWAQLRWILMFFFLFSFIVAHVVPLTELALYWGCRPVM